MKQQESIEDVWSRPFIFLQIPQLQSGPPNINHTLLP
jgi:hypothetical protein